jgi:hypothetical protein
MSNNQEIYSIWIDDETRDDGTYDVIVYDESADETDWNLSKGHIATLNQAEETLNNIIRNNHQIHFERKPTIVK